MQGDLVLLFPILMVVVLIGIGVAAFIMFRFYDDRFK